VELMPEGADPMDLRLQLIQWIHPGDAGMVVWGDSDRFRRTEKSSRACIAGVAAGAAGLFDCGGIAGAISRTAKLCPAGQDRAPSRFRATKALGGGCDNWRRMKWGNTLGLMHNYSASNG